MLLFGGSPVSNYCIPTACSKWNACAPQELSFVNGCCSNVPMIPIMPSKLFTDEAEFTRDCIINIHHQHLWAYVNTHGIILSGHQTQFPIIVGMGIPKDIMTGHVPQNMLTGAVYHNCL
jgi:hypothetical protein